MKYVRTSVRNGSKLTSKTRKCQKFCRFLTFPVKFYLGSELKRVATGSVSKKYQTSLFFQLSKPFLENVNFDRVCRIFNIHNAPSTITSFGVHLPKEIVSSDFGG